MHGLKIEEEKKERKKKGKLSTVKEAVAADPRPPEFGGWERSIVSESSLRPWEPINEKDAQIRFVSTKNLLARNF